MSEIQKLCHAKGVYGKFGNWLVADSKKVFNQFDYDLSGRLSVQELEGAARQWVEKVVKLPYSGCLMVGLMGRRSCAHADCWEW